MKAGIKIAICVCMLLFASCNKKKGTGAADSSATTTTTGSTTSAPATIDINHDAVAQYEVDGTTFSYPASGITSGMETTVSRTASASKYMYSSFFANGSTTYFGIDKGMIQVSGTGKPDEQMFRDFFQAGNVPYLPNMEYGVQIKHRDASGKMWYSVKGPQGGSASQTTSVFKIEAVKEEMLGSQSMKVFATFNCALYDDNGNKKILTNGKFVGYFQNN